MAGVLQHLRSSTLNKRPNPASMVDGQIAINYASGAPGMFFKNSNGSLVKVGPVHVGSGAPNAVPASGGTAGNSIGEQWLDTSGGTYVFKIWDGAAWRSEAGEFVNATGDTMTGDLVMNNANLVFEGSVDDGFETTLTVVNPTADRTITLPNVTGTVVTTGDSGTVTSAMIADGTIVNGDVNASAAIAGTKISPDFGSQTIQTTGIISHALGSASAPTLTFTGDTNTGIYSPGADQVAISTNGTGRLFVDSNGYVDVASTSSSLSIVSLNATTTGNASLRFSDTTANAGNINYNFTDDAMTFRVNASERLRIDSSGRLGLGTSSPKSLLHVAGDHSNTANSYIASNLYFDGGWKYINNGYAAALKLANSAGFISFETAPQNTGGVDASATLSTRLVITPTGNVGIGTTSPGVSLDVNGSARVRNGNGYQWIGESAATDTKLWDVYTDNSSANTLWFRCLNDAFSASNPWMSVTRTGASPTAIRWYIGASEAARIDSSGRLGLGTSSPGQLLHVANGSAWVGAPTSSSSGTVAIYGDGNNGSIEVFAGNSTSTKRNLLLCPYGGAVGIGTTDPVEKLEVRGGNIGLDSAGSVVGDRTTERFYKRTDNGSSNGMAAIGMNGAGTNGFLGEIKFYTGASDVFNASLSERARIDSSGRLLVGTSSSINTTALGNAQVQVVGTTNETAQLAISRFSNDADRGRLAFIKSRGASGTNAIVQADDAIGRIEFLAADGGSSTAYPGAANIGVFVDGTPGLNDMPGRLVFSTTADGASSPTEQLRITNDGVHAYNQGAPAAVNATATLTVANLKTGIITSTSAAATDMTLPTGTDTEAGFSGIYTNMTFEWSVINTGPSLVRVLAGTAHTIVGSGSVATGTSGRFASRRTAANTFVTYRLS